MKRRDFLAIVGYALTARPVAGVAQQSPKLPRIAIVSPSTPVDQMNEEAGNRIARAFFGGLRRLGHSEGTNLTILRYSALGHRERYEALAREAADANPDVIIVTGPLLARAVNNATKTIPIVGAIADPIRWGLISNLGHPGGNLTGVGSDSGIEVLGKCVQLLREVIPSVGEVAYLSLREAWEGPSGQGLRAAGQQLGISLIGMSLNEASPSEYQRVFDAATVDRPDAVVVSSSPVVFAYRDLIVQLAERHSLPAIYQAREFVDAGGLMAYGADQVEVWRHMADAVHLILSGTAPGDIPFYQPVKFELFINMRAANALGLAIPPVLVARADEIIE
jgi:putative ABC transport system substrate-binding protein